MTGAESPAEIAARDAEQEAERLRADAQLAMALEDQSDLQYDVASDAISAYWRAVERAKEARALADYRAGVFNPWSAA